MSAFQQVIIFLVTTLFDLYISFLLIRMLLGFAGADFRNPISQFLLKVTSPVLVPLRRFVPPIGKIDTAAVLAAMGIKAVEVFLVMLVLGLGISGEGAFKLIVGGLLHSIIWIYIVALLIQAVISWVGSGQGNPIAPLLHSLTEPLIRPVRKIIPTIGMVDLSPLAVILLLQVVLILIQPVVCNSMFACMEHSASTSVLTN